MHLLFYDKIPLMPIKIDGGDSGGYSPGAYYKEIKPSKVDVNNSADVSKWANVLGISEAELLDNVRTYGPVIRDIRRGRLGELDEVA